MRVGSLKIVVYGVPVVVAVDKQQSISVKLAIASRLVFSMCEKDEVLAAQSLKVWEGEGATLVKYALLAVHILPILSLGRHAQSRFPPSFRGDKIRNRENDRFKFCHRVNQ